MSNETVSKEPKIIPKLSIKGMDAAPKKNELKEGESRDLCVIFGQVTSGETITTTYGDSIRFTGSFIGRRLSDNAEFRSGRAFLPSILENMLADTLSGADSQVEFAVVIGAEYSAKGNTGYAFTVRPLMPVKESDALQALRDHVDAKLKALPNPDNGEKEKKGKK